MIVTNQHYDGIEYNVDIFTSAQRPKTYNFSAPHRYNCST